MIDPGILDWLLEGDVSIQYQVYRDLLDNDRADLRSRINTEGWGARFLSARRADGHWGRAYYQPKWTSTHYTLLDLKNLCIAPDHPEMRETIMLILETHKAKDGGILPVGQSGLSDLCIDGMFLNVASYFGAEVGHLESIVDLLIKQQMVDGGFNCRITHDRVVHSSMHTTISVLEGLQEYLAGGYHYHRGDLERIAREAREFLLLHRLYLSDHSGEVIDQRFIMLSHPARWRYDILRALEHLRIAGVGYDPRMQAALDVLLKKRRKDGTWPLQARHPGQTHFEMETPGKPSRWNTLRALRVLKRFSEAQLS
jgi:hypothetical protein